MKVPAHKASLTLTHNDHIDNYSTVAQAVSDRQHGYDERCWVSEEQKKKAIHTNDCWFLQWYPNTPVGFNILAAADLGVLLEAACEMAGETAEFE